ncbi:carbonic anhydrase family protein [Lacticaseibacillus zhaodongensis]|uniref:carbonic anhydrase family protein n=1 Tax=Lacticaseibacillus zhaodongensis TaxID=2668065 RepID=UPI0018B00D52|nr:carbonic anhydrase family protein [Lacticaseibacillus zhaodongensis]
MFDYQHQSDWQIISGQEQSPVALDSKTAQSVKWPAPDFATLRGTDSDRSTYTITIAGTGNDVLDGRPATFQQLHFHSQGEHVIDGVRAPLEAHFVHQYADGGLAVVAVPFVVGAANPTFGEVLTAVATGELAYPIKLAALLPKQTDWLHYRGSLTTPPVQEGVAWYVATQPLTVSVQQLAMYQEYFPADNHRALQDLNGRPVLKLESK